MLLSFAGVAHMIHVKLVDSGYDVETIFCKTKKNLFKTSYDKTVLK